MFQFSRRCVLGARWARTLINIPKAMLALLLGASIAYAAGPIADPDRPFVPVIDLGVAPTDPVPAGSIQLAAVGDEADAPGTDLVSPDTVKQPSTDIVAEDIAPNAAETADVLRAGTAVQMSAVARVTLRILGFSELNGDYAIDAGTLSIPGVGRFDVADKSIGELEAALTARLSEAFRREIAVSVEVNRYAPYFVTGQVAQPGEIAWRPGLTVIQAIALAGGEQRGPGGVTADNLPTIQQARSQVMFSLAELERLNAEKHELKGFAPSEQSNTGSKTGNPEFDALAHRQNELLQERRGMMQTQVDGLRKEHDSALTLLKSSEAQVEAVEGQLKLARSMLSGIQKLHAKKLVANSRFMEQQRDVAGIELQLTEMRGLAEVARARVASTDRQITVFQQQRLAAINERIEVLQRDIALNESTIASFSSTPATETPAPAVLEYNIARRTGGVVETIPAHVFTEVLPGDVIIVSPRPAEPQRSAGADSTRFGAVSDPMRETIVRTERLIQSSTASRSVSGGLAGGLLQRMAVNPVVRR